MSDVAGAYCATEDLRLGDIRPMVPKEDYVKNGAEEIDAALGSLYITPIVIDGSVAKNRPAILTLKKINWLLASGRAILDMAAAGENTSQHAYGMGMLKEGLAMLAQIVGEDMLLVGAPLLPEEDDGQKDYTGPLIQNEDPESLVESFYQRGTELFTYPFGRAQPQPYGHKKGYW